MSPATRDRIVELLERQTVALAAVRGRAALRCPVCAVLLPGGTEAEHAGSMGDREHLVMEVMES